MQHYATARVTLEYGRTRWSFATEGAIRSPLSGPYVRGDRMTAVWLGDIAVGRGG